tara:strand:- start:233 stop:361 length:129 start_codon:yes stop_codon:yes gene_type:complete
MKGRKRAQSPPSVGAQMLGRTLLFVIMDGSDAPPISKASKMV